MALIQITLDAFTRSLLSKELNGVRRRLVHSTSVRAAEACTQQWLVHGAMDYTVRSDVQWASTVNLLNEATGTQTCLRLHAAIIDAEPKPRSKNKAIAQAIRR
jgi:hypothetical protein